MLRTCIGITILGGLALFGYFFFTGAQGTSTGDRAKKALSDTGEVVVDQSLAAAVHVRLAAGAGMDAARFLHVYNHSGAVVVYGLLPDGFTSEQVAAWAGGVPGVKSVEVLVVPRPAHIPAAVGAPMAP